MISQTFEVDNIDKKIMGLIQIKPTITHTKISKAVDRSQPTVGLRIKKLEEKGALDYQAGINLKRAPLHLARIDIETNTPQEFMDLVKVCPFMFNAYRLSGKMNLSITIAVNDIKFLDKMVNLHFRNNDAVQDLSVNIITDMANDLVLPVNLDYKGCDFELKPLCMEHEITK
jgi:DNA-binding Lrp family transcriptional regulator